MRAILFALAAFVLPILLILTVHNSLGNDDESAPTVLGFFLVIGAVAIFVTQIGRRRRLLQERSEELSIDLALTNISSSLRSRFDFIYDTGGGNYLCMDNSGENVHFLQVELNKGVVSVANELGVSVSDIVSVDVVLRERTEIDTITETRRKGAITRAVVGDVFFGPAGAIVGATSARSRSTSVGVQRKVYESSELVFGLSDLRNPVVRFVCYDHSKADEWLHRVRSAMARVAAKR